MSKTSLAIIFVILALWGATAWGLKRANDQLESGVRKADSLAAQILVERAEAIGWETRFGERGIELARKDTALALLGRELMAARTETRSLTTLLAQARGRIRVDTVTIIENAVTEEPSYQGSFDDGLLVGSWVLVPPRFDLNYQASIPGQILTAETGDGSFVVFARALDPRATLRVDSVLFEPPRPVVERGWLRWYHLPIAVLAGFILGS